MTSLPKRNGNNSVVMNQFADIPDRICPAILPQYNATLIRQYNNNGRSNFTVDLMLESDPAALQALLSIDVAIARYPIISRLANKFVSFSMIYHSYVDTYLN